MWVFNPSCLLPCAYGFTQPGCVHLLCALEHQTTLRLVIPAQHPPPCCLFPHSPSLNFEIKGTCICNTQISTKVLTAPLFTLHAAQDAEEQTVSSFSFTYDPSLTPWLSTITPSRGSTEGGTPVVLRGTFSANGSLPVGLGFKEFRIQGSGRGVNTRLLC